MKKLLIIISVLALVLIFPGCNKEKKPEGNKDAVLAFDSFDGGGPEYKVKVKDKSIIFYTCEKRYDKKDHEELDGASFDIVYTFKGLKAGKTQITVKGDSPNNKNYYAIYNATVDKNLNVTLKAK